MNEPDGQGKTTALWALTPHGAVLASALAESLPGSTVFLSENLETHHAPAQRFSSLKQTVADHFGAFDAHVFFMATGIVVRVIADHLVHKIHDPAVVVVDDRGMFAISLVSGHVGGANDLAVQVAGLLGATPVITTATDVNKRPSIDTMAVEKKLGIENPEAIKTVNMAFLAGKPVGIFDPYGFFRDKMELFDGSVQEPKVCVDDRMGQAGSGDLMLRPQTLVAGIGCNRNTGKDEIKGLLMDTLDQHGLSLRSLAFIASVDVKHDERGLLELAKELKVLLRFFSRDELAGVETIQTPSETVEKHMGVKSVCEAAAILGAKKGSLIVPKRKTANATVAVARINFTS